ncbi:hypothetical protein TREMEDRAFT_65016 [Tremella mesenterica DSM 1558]|uniref:uncharacterized protein n=1 Tax=Tremella mesenterica (strain ATCC 24925 / CBS 8224 / DSM 1558 / NBRC 9311 / NRRL Y-6157 / RJB 2259-6 / UBC 559-6) TaxID=578456 RepID=UPI0003F49FE7|nr:uncharacterized protein TREMEDRAFT_65016 [Tremella mesenterica DSM 1558]EIW67148.1 hypothetical protein TREMEDRAFT_65016 [Tremella mesenterica DSM 1558]
MPYVSPLSLSISSFPSLDSHLLPLNPILPSDQPREQESTFASDNNKEQEEEKENEEEKKGIHMTMSIFPPQLATLPHMSNQDREDDLTPRPTPNLPEGLASLSLNSPFPYTPMGGPVAGGSGVDNGGASGMNRAGGGEDVTHGLKGIPRTLPEQDQVKRPLGEVGNIPKLAGGLDAHETRTDKVDGGGKPFVSAVNINIGKDDRGKERDVKGVEGRKTGQHGSPEHIDTSSPLVDDHDDTIREMDEMEVPGLSITPSTTASSISIVSPSLSSEEDSPKGDRKNAGSPTTSVEADDWDDRLRKYTWGLYNHTLNQFREAKQRGGSRKNSPIAENIPQFGHKESGMQKMAAQKRLARQLNS